MLRLTRICAACAAWILALTITSNLIKSRKRESREWAENLRRPFSTTSLFVSLSKGSTKEPALCLTWYWKRTPPTSRHGIERSRTISLSHKLTRPWRQLRKLKNMPCFKMIKWSLDNSNRKSLKSKTKKKNSVKKLSLLVSMRISPQQLKTPNKQSNSALKKPWNKRMRCFWPWVTLNGFSIHSLRQLKCLQENFVVAGSRLEQRTIEFYWYKEWSSILHQKFYMS